jgi:hypothetical protein
VCVYVCMYACMYACMLTNDAHALTHVRYRDQRQGSPNTDGSGGVGGDAAGAGASSADSPHMCNALMQVVMCIYTHMYIYIYMCMCIYIYIHTSAANTSAHPKHTIHTRLAPVMFCM